MNFTDSPFEKMMKWVPPAPRPQHRKPPAESACAGCSYWRDMACVGTCYLDLTSATISGRFGPKPAGAPQPG